MIRLLLFVLFLLPFSIIGIIQDIRYRKIKNWVSLTFLYLCVLVFAFHVTIFDIPDFITLIIAILGGFYFYKKELWGGGDGKVFMAMAFLLISYAGALIFIHYLINLIVFYTIAILFLIFFITTKKAKKRNFKEINLGFHLFSLLFIFIFVKNIIAYISFESALYHLAFIIFVLFLVSVFNPYLKTFYYGFEDKRLRIALNTSLILIFLFFSYNYIAAFIYFALILTFRISLDFTVKMTKHIKSKEEFYQSPFLIYLFLSAIFTLLSNNNIISIIINLFR